MHALLAHAYHLARLPFWRPVALALAVAALARLTGQTRTPRGAALSAALAVLAGWFVQGLPYAVWPPAPVARLAGLALIGLADTVVRSGARRGAPWWLLPATALAAAWWLRGAPVTGAAIVNLMPVFLGLALALPLARRLARGDSGWGSLGAALALAGSLAVAGAPLPWVRAGLVPAATAAVLLGVREAAPSLAGLLVLAGTAALVDADHGRLGPVDAACLLPLLAWPLVPRLTPRISRSGPALAGIFAAGLCIALAWAATRALVAR